MEEGEGSVSAAARGAKSPERKPETDFIYGANPGRFGVYLLRRHGQAWPGGPAWVCVGRHGW